MVERVKTGIFGLDDLLEGGFPKGRTILVSGTCGTGKSILGMQFAYCGAVEYGEPSIFVTTDERPELFSEDMLRFGWDVKKAEQGGKFALFDVTATHIGVPSTSMYSMSQVSTDSERLISRLAQLCGEMKAKRVVIDSLASLGLQMKDDAEIRRAILKINYSLSKAGATTILTSEIPNSAPGCFSKHGVEEYAVDGVVVLSYNVEQEFPRTLFIRKMRGTRHSEHIHPIDITAKGISVGKFGEE